MARKTKAEIQSERITRRITKELFRNVQGQVAQRLVLEMADKSDAGGWGTAGLSSTVYRIILDELKTGPH